MNKRLLKRHKRQVSREKAQGKASEPDLRTPEQVRAARETNRPEGGWGRGPRGRRAMPQIRNHAGQAASSSIKADA